MAESFTTRLGLPRWTAGGDTLNRGELDSAMASLESLVVKYAAGDTAARPAAAASQAGALFVHITGTEAGRTEYGDGATWRDLISRVTKLAVAPVAADVGVAVKLAAGQTGNAVEVRNSANTLLTVVNNSGSLGTTGLFRAGDVGFDTAMQAFIGSQDAARRGLVVRLAAAATANAVEVQNSGGSVVVRFAPDGDLLIDRRFGPTAGAVAGVMASLIRKDTDTGNFITATTATTGERFEVFSDGAVKTAARFLSAGGVHAGNSDATYGTTVALAAFSLAAGQIAGVIRGAASQSANIFEVQNSGGFSEFHVDSAMRLRITGGAVTTTATAGAAGAPPAQVAGYFTIHDGTTYRKVPFFAL